jgi:hypothetical protein
MLGVLDPSALMNTTAGVEAGASLGLAVWTRKTGMVRVLVRIIGSGVGDGTALSIMKSYALSEGDREGDAEGSLEATLLNGRLMGRWLLWHTAFKRRQSR